MSHTLSDAAVVPLHEQPSADTAVVSVPSLDVNGNSYTANNLTLQTAAEVKADIEKEFTEDPKAFAKGQGGGIKPFCISAEEKSDVLGDELYGTRQEKKEMEAIHAEESAALKAKQNEMEARHAEESAAMKARETAAFEAYDASLQSLILVHGIFKFVKGLFKCAQKTAKDRKGDIQALRDGEDDEVQFTGETTVEQRNAAGFASAIDLTNEDDGSDAEGDDDRVRPARPRRRRVLDDDDD